MFRHLILALVILALPPARAEQVTLTCADPFSLTTVNPERPSLAQGAVGGIDAGMIGDTDYFLLGDHEVGKQWYGANDAAIIHFIARGPVTIEVGHRKNQWGSRTGEVLLDGKLLGTFSELAKPDAVATEKYEVEGSGEVQALLVRPAAKVGNYVQLDAVRLTAQGSVQIVDARGRPVLVPSAALAPERAQAVAARLAQAPNLARAGAGMSYVASEEFATGIDGSQSYSARAALGGGEGLGGYWAGGTAPPHALTLTWQAPVTLTTNRITWLGLNHGLWYGLEYWDGACWRLLYEERRNLQEQPIYQFAAVTTTRVRLTILSLTGDQRVLMKAFELYNLPDGGER